MTGSVSARPTPLVLVLLAPVAGLLTVALAWSDHTMLLVNDRISTVGYGVPIDWLMQSNLLTPPLELMPYELSPDDPRETPTAVAWRPLAMDVLLLYAVLLAALLAVRLVLRRAVPAARRSR